MCEVTTKSANYGGITVLARVFEYKITGFFWWKKYTKQTIRGVIRVDNNWYFTDTIDKCPISVIKAYSNWYTNKHVNDEYHLVKSAIKNHKSINQ